ncbi:acetyltransferase [Deinococcus cavernae]|uniref:Acetyltransferase n=1 Tax=Deinococcus cavernae TaxID=2320857 RepID=A0A418UZR9_9DEIO|nr:acetyltransferase [Deinococcus cavernae]RJF68974.1 acetyltransferase [Deinococcus cavernae]
MDILNQRLVIFGTGGHAREIHATVEALDDMAPGEYEFLGWLDGNEQKHGASIRGLPVLGGVEWLADHPEVEVMVGIGAPAVRRRVIQQIMAAGHAAFATLISPHARMGSRVTVGRGVYVAPGAICTTEIRVGDFAHINTGALLSHDVQVGEYAMISPRAALAGNVTVGAGTDVGLNASVIQGQTIGAWSVVGAQAMVRSDLPANCVAVGVPAKVIKARDAGWHELIAPPPARRVDAMMH